jgi:hypothetical protein
MLTRDQILATDDLEREEIPVPEWDGSVFVRTLRLSERLALETDLAGSPPDALAVVTAACACDEGGNLLFTRDDVAALGAKSSKVLHRIFTAAMALNSLTAEDLGELRKNSEASPSDGSVSGSRHL